METNSHTMSNIELTEMWLDGKFDEVIWEITDSKQFMEKDDQKRNMGVSVVFHYSMQGR